MNSLKTIENIYHPYRITLKNQINIIESSSGKFILKKEDKDLFTLYSYLDSRGLNCYPLLIRNFNEEENLLEYVNKVDLPKEQYLEEMARELGNLHLKTSYDKNVTLDEILFIKDNIENNIKYLEQKYRLIIKEILLHEYMEPKEYLFIRNYYKIEEALDFCQRELNSWYDAIKDQNSVRVCLLHNNLSLEHFIVSESKNVFISFDHYRFDMPLLDLVKFYNDSKIYNEFSFFLRQYFKIIDYSKEERSLLFLLLSLPDNIELNDNMNTLVDKIDKVFITEELIRPYYTEDQKE